MAARVARGVRIALIAAAGGLTGLVVVEVSLRLVGFGTPIVYDNRATYGYRPLPDQTRRRLFGATVHVNALGLRGPEAPANGLRVLFLGDSVTWGGSYVDDTQLFAAVAADTVARRLPDRFPQVVALDAGVNAWGPQNIAALVGERGGFGSSLWVLTLLDDDFRREKTRMGEVPYFNTAPATAVEELLVLAGYHLVTAYKQPKPPADLERIVDENFVACRLVFETARATGARLLVAWHPTAPALQGSPEVYKGRLLEAAATANVPVLDLAAAYGQGDGVYVDGVHLSVAGHRVAGAAIGERLAAMLADAAPR